MEYINIKGVPDFSCKEYREKKTKYCLCIPIINEKDNIRLELMRARMNRVHTLVDIIICDGGSSDGGTDDDVMEALGVNTLLTKRGAGKQGAQLRMGFYWALKRGYEGIITIDGNNKDSIEDVVKFIEKLDEGYDFIQGSRFIAGGQAINTPLSRHLAVKYIHAPVISLTAREKFTDTTNNFRGYSRKYLTHPMVQPFRSVFKTYELLAYLSTRASQLNLKTCEVPVTRAYPNDGKIPTKISPIKGNSELMKILMANAVGMYNPK
ncbi:MAG: glycosyltransferase family 2 protein [Oscillospiraceae bacterium]|nr:glycosyltransferase family 2 protein [Oscillospiraceae bacterium]MBR6609332.1 glycosyltransferase family 2 protein [Oscillospiraceae bacterium]